MNTGISTLGIVLGMLALTTPASAQQEVTPTVIVAPQYERDWNKGSKLEADGLRDLEKAKKDLVRYSADVVDAQNKRDSSRARAENAASEFRKLTASQSYFSDVEEAARWARQVEKAAAEWAKYDDRRGDGRDELESASKKQRRAQEAVDKAQAKIDRGRTMKAEAERLSMLERRTN